MEKEQINGARLDGNFRQYLLIFKQFITIHKRFNSTKDIPPHSAVVVR